MAKGGSKMSSSGGGASSSTPPKFAATDSGPFRAMSDAEASAYLVRQAITPVQQAAIDLYTNPNTTPGSLYNFSQNMNYKHAQGLPMTQQERDVFNTIDGAMHNLGYNATLSRYDHASTVDELLRQVGSSGNASTMTLSRLKQALVGVSYKDDRILSTSVNDFKNSSDPSTFNTRQYKFTYRAKAGAKGFMPGQGKTPMRNSGKSKGDDFGEMLLGRSNNYRIVDVRYTGKKARAKGRPKWDLSKRQIEIIVEVDG